MKHNGIQAGKSRKNGHALTPKFGPVDNLESYLQPDWWRRIFNSMYLKTDADVVEDKQITNREIDLFMEFLSLDKNMVILDLACGQGRHTLELARRGFRFVNGLDRSHYLIRKAKNTCVSEGLTANFKEGDARKLPYQTDTFDLVMILGNSFGYFESLDDDMKILREVFRVLKPNGRFLIDVADGNYLRDNYNPRSWEWIDNKHFVCRERSLASDKQRLISREVISNIHKGVIVDQFYAERLYSHESLQEILTQCGYKDISFMGNYTTDSKRNQDLGMMERRIIVTAAARKEWTPVKAKKAGLKTVAVVMGDPERPDIIKPLNVFDRDDIETVMNLKIALGELKDYRFLYYSNHATIFNDLQKLKGRIDFVFNLCDEGFNNNPRMELHVPAMLEILGIPYTGSNPQCLTYCYDKSLIRGIAQEMGVPVARGLYIKPEDNVFEMNIDFPVIIKPNYGDSSFGITRESVANNLEELNDAIIRIREKVGFENPVLLEEFLTGKDLTIGIIGNPPDPYTFLPVVEEDYSDLPAGLPRICGYEAKWLADSPYFKLLKSVPANLPEETEKVIMEHCLRLFERLDCKDYVRFDWRLDQGGIPKLLEVNPNPGWCWDGHLAKMAAIKGISYPDMLLGILQTAEQRINNVIQGVKTEERKAMVNV
ncbi:MAG: methyltransferase domain-containing protein [Bacteroidales bacterium]|nr:methyltransferase domain-containing protein [Bacteroidales bacterium]MBN2763339.1 methyltransferase domain-containing protein [Bacteroidales bacterium]